ncbi:MAG: hypothetical protein MJA84_18055 [Firmicutes bacterium]|nr:hypothetical protein [Bacillota bacterium]
MSELRSWEPSPSENRQFQLEQIFGRHVGGGLNEAADWVDPVTPLADFVHRRQQEAPFTWEDPMLLLGAIPGIGKGVGKAVGKAARRIPPYKRSPSTTKDFASEIGSVLETGESSKGKLFRSDLGEIAIDLGTPGDPRRGYKGGYGLSHIIDKRTDVDGIDGEAFVRKRLPEVLANGRLRRFLRGGDRRRALIETPQERVVLQLYRDGERETWVITGYEKY